MQQTLWDVIVEVVKGRPMAVISRFWKYEDGKNRLLFTADFFSYVLFCFVLRPIEMVLGEDTDKQEQRDGEEDTPQKIQPSQPLPAYAERMRGLGVISTESFSMCVCQSSGTEYLVSAPNPSQI